MTASLLTLEVVVEEPRPSGKARKVSLHGAWGILSSLLSELVFQVPGGKPWSREARVHQWTWKLCRGEGMSSAGSHGEVSPGQGSAGGMASALQGCRYSRRQGLAYLDLQYQRGPLVSLNCGLGPWAPTAHPLLGSAVVPT